MPPECACANCGRRRGGPMIEVRWHVLAGQDGWLAAA